MKVNRRAIWWGIGAAVVLATGGLAVTVTMTSSGIGPVVSGPPVTRRLTSVQYQNIIHDVFGGDIDIGGRLPPDLRIEGLLALGAGQVSVTPAGMEQYDAMARAIADQVVDENHRDMLVRCKPASTTGPDAQCARQFLADAGLLLYRRPLTDQQLEAYVTAANEAADITQDFYAGIKLSLSAMLTSPAFLFRVEVIEPDPDREGAFRLDAYSKASQLSFFLWNSAPDSLLLSAAESGQLHTRRGLKAQVERMIDSPRLQAGIRAFFSDQLRFTEFANLAKDAQLFPKFNAEVAADAREQTLRTIMNVVFTENRDFRDIFTTKETFLTPALGAIYRVPIYKQGPNGSPDEWQPYEFAADDPRAGILTQVAFTALHSPAGRGSPTIRGMAVREIALCQAVPAPPGDVDFSMFLQAAANPTSTARERLGAHASVPSCAGCHKIMDPIGLALENFDGAGGYRTQESGQPIDPSGVLDGIPFENAAGLGEAVYKNPAAVSCLVNRLSERALGRQVTSGEREWLEHLRRDFEDNGYRLLALMEKIASSEALYSVSPTQHVASASVASNREVTQ